MNDIDRILFKNSTPLLFKWMPPNFSPLWICFNEIWMLLIWAKCFSIKMFHIAISSCNRLTNLWNQINQCKSQWYFIKILACLLRRDQSLRDFLHFWNKAGKIRYYVSLAQKLKSLKTFSDSLVLKSPTRIMFSYFAPYTSKVFEMLSK